MRSYTPSASGSFATISATRMESSESERIPIISFMEPRSISTAALMMKPEMTTPTYASRLIFVNVKIRAAAKTDVESMASKRASDPEAMSVSE